MIDTIIFDFDGTLSSERDYIYGCFKFVEADIMKKFGINDAYEKLKILFNQSWKNIFNRLLVQENIKYTENDIKDLIMKYREAPPIVNLYEDTIPALQKIRGMGIKTAVITNGFYKIQREKIRKSGLEALLDAVDIPDYYGREYWKPDIRRVQNLMTELRTEPENVLYIGDSDSDFEMTHNAGMQMAFIKRQDRVSEFHYKEVVSYLIKDLLEIDKIIKSKF